MPQNVIPYLLLRIKAAFSFLLKSLFKLIAQVVYWSSSCFEIVHTDHPSNVYVKCVYLWVHGLSFLWILKQFLERWWEGGILGSTPGENPESEAAVSPRPVLVVAPFLLLLTDGENWNVSLFPTRLSLWSHFDNTFPKLFSPWELT